ncbi:hypothetical protein AX17_000903 [Amanita inopinata Kibby_2008]|nr:hypothetical protein AX17_000903 [Amanita inopinata Kibby_2008]
MLLFRRSPIKLARQRFTRQSSAAATCDPSKIRNLAIVAHIDSGKTTLTESILLQSSYLSVAGSVDTGSTTTDFLPAERERGITIQSASIPVHWKNWTYNLIDTPGHADFGMEVESASRVVDGAVILMDSVEGVESQTTGVWTQLDRYDVASRIIFLNKLDRPGASFRASLESILLHQLHPCPMVLNLPIASFKPIDYSQAEPGLQGLIDLVNWKLWKWNDGVPSSYNLPDKPQELGSLNYIASDHPVLTHMFSARSQLLENLSMFSDDLLELLLSGSSSSNGYLDVPSSDIMRCLRKATLNNDIVPVLCGSAIKHIGTELVLDYAGELLASPVDVAHEPQKRNARLMMLAWKVIWDNKRGWMTFVRIYSGKLSRQSTILNTNRNQREKVSKILLLYASNAVEVDELSFGSVGVILGMKHTRTGDTLISLSGSTGSQRLMRDITPPPAVISTSVTPRSHADLEPVQEALNALIRTDPSVRIETQEGQLLVHGLGALHLEIIESRLRDEWRAHFEFGKRRVSYREGLGPTCCPESSDIWQTDVGGRHVSISVRLDVTSLKDSEQGDPNWDGNVVLDATGTPMPSPESHSGTLESYMAQGISSVLSNSPHTSLAMSGLRIQVKGHTLPPSIPPSFLAGGTASILRNNIRAAGPGHLLEPYVLLKINVNESNLGRVIKDLAEHGGEVQDLGFETTPRQKNIDLFNNPTKTVYIPPQWLSPSFYNAPEHDTIPDRRRSIFALAPLSQFLDYSARLRALSGGHGVFEMLNAGYRKVSNERCLEILKEIGRA